MSGALSEDARIECLNAMLRKFSHTTPPAVRKIADGTATREQTARLGIHPVIFAFFTRVPPPVSGNLIGRRDAMCGGAIYCRPIR